MKTRGGYIAAICTAQPSYEQTEAGMLVDALAALGVIEIATPPTVAEAAAAKIAGDRSIEIESSDHFYQGCYWLSKRGARQVIEKLQAAGFEIVPK